MRSAILILTALLLVGCQTPGGLLSPSNPSSSTAAGGFGAQTVGGDQGQAQTPQTTSAGPATLNWIFASVIDAANQAAILKLAEDNHWTSAEVIAALKASNGAPETVTITTQDISVTTGSPEATGASGGTGGGGMVKPPQSP